MIWHRQVIRNVDDTEPLEHIEEMRLRPVCSRIQLECDHGSTAGHLSFSQAILRVRCQARVSHLPDERVVIR